MMKTLNVLLNAMKVMKCLKDSMMRILRYAWLEGYGIALKQKAATSQQKIIF